jgi:hypothetical protein
MRSTLPSRVVECGAMDRVETLYTGGRNTAIAGGLLLVVTLGIGVLLLATGELVGGMILSILGPILCGMTALIGGSLERSVSVSVATAPVGSPRRTLYYQSRSVFGSCCGCQAGAGQRHTVAEVKYVFTDGNVTTLYTHGHVRMVVFDPSSTKKSDSSTGCCPPPTRVEAQWRAYLNPTDPTALAPPPGWRPAAHGD